MKPRRRQKVLTLKEVRMSPKIDTHDLQIKMRNAERFLKDGDKVKITVRFRGREIVHADMARAETDRAGGRAERHLRRGAAAQA